MDSRQLNGFVTYEDSYYQLVFEISCLMHNGIGQILDSKQTIKKVYNSGGFSINVIFIVFLKLLMPD